MCNKDEGESKGRVKNMETDRKKEVINACLDHFIDKGLSETSTRSLSSALKLQTAGLYYYFTSKDEAVVQCAEEAVLRLENSLIYPAIKDIVAPDIMIKRLLSRAEEMAPTMKFFVSVCVSARYKNEMKVLLNRLADRYVIYFAKIAAVINCDKEKIEPYVYMATTSIVNYMIFAEKLLIQSQLEIVKDEISSILRRNYRVTFLVKYGKLVKECPDEQKIAQ